MQEQKFTFLPKLYQNYFKINIQGISPYRATIKKDAQADQGKKTAIR